jgi:hypothetical protein
VKCGRVCVPAPTAASNAITAVKRMQSEWSQFVVYSEATRGRLARAKKKKAEEEQKEEQKKKKKKKRKKKNDKIAEKRVTARDEPRVAWQRLSLRGRTRRRLLHPRNRHPRRRLLRKNASF